MSLRVRVDAELRDQIPSLPQMCPQLHPPAWPQSPQGFASLGYMGRQLGSLGLLGKTGRAEAGTGEG